MRMIAVPSRSRRSRSRSRMPAWMVTSSAVVGSSAISTFGSQATAIAIITRWRMPPDSWCGYSSIRRARRRDPDELEQLDARGRAPPCGDSPRWRRSTSPICRPTVNDRVQRGHRLLEDERDLAAAHAAQRSLVGGRAGRGPSKRDRAADSAPSAGSSPSIDIAVTLLPQPDSPTIAEHLAGVERERHAVDGVHGPSSSESKPRREQARRPRAAPSSRHPRVEDVAQAVAEQVEGQRRQRDREAGEDRQPRRPRRGTAARRRASRPTTASAAGRRARGTTAAPRRGSPAGSSTVACTMQRARQVGQDVAAQDRRVARAVGDRRRARSPPRVSAQRLAARHADDAGDRANAERDRRVGAATGRGSPPARRPGSGTGTPAPRR